MREDVNIIDGHSTFDFKGFIFKVLSYWKLFVICILLGCLVAYYLNVRKKNIYALESLITIENEQNPFFTSNTSISFNWGGVTGKVETVLTSLKTRNHNEKVVDSLEFYLQYLKKGKYHLEDIYKKSPFYLEIEKDKWQILDRIIGIRFLNVSEYELFVDEDFLSTQIQRYSNREKKSVQIPEGSFPKKYKIGEKVSLPYLNFTLNLREGVVAVPESEYYFRFENFDAIVNKYKSSVAVSPNTKGSSILKLRLTGTNKAKIVDFLNATTEILSKTDLERKNLYATKTIEFIDNQLDSVSKDLKDVEKELNTFRKTNKMYDIDEGNKDLTSKLQEADFKQTESQSKLDYLSSLENYLSTKTNYADISAPSAVGIDDGNIISSVERITSLSIHRQTLEYTTREGSGLFKDIDRKISAEKNVLLELISSTRKTIQFNLSVVNRDLAKLENKISELPEDQQQLLKIQRQYNLNEETYNVFLTKRGEASVVKAANVSDIIVMDEAKDIGGGLIGPNRDLNYFIALFVGILIPLVYIFIIVFLDNNIHVPADIVALTNIPILGVVGKNKLGKNLIVFEKPKSAISEGFRSIRSSLQYIYKEQKIEGTKTVMVTSSVSGEGKTFCSINIATVFALTKKRTVLVGLDLRKPKIFGDFKLENTVGAVNYLIGDKSLKQIIQETHIPNLDLIVSGPVPPNPSELLMSDRMTQLIDDLKKDYDYIVLDTPPIGLVTDAIELVEHVDASIYMVRQDYTKKGMLSYIDDKYNKGELKNISIVLNDYKHNAKYSYGYGDYGAYANGYHEDDTKKRSIGLRVKSLFKK